MGIVNEDFVRNRITALRMKKGVSEYQMSLDLGRSQSYIQNISSGKTMPSINGLFSICDYLGIPVKDFFDEEAANPLLIQQVLKGIKDLEDEDIRLLIQLITRLGTSIKTR